MSTQNYTNLTTAQESYIYFVASGCNSDGKKISQTAYADTIGVSRKTLYNWQKAIPQFWEKVQETRRSYYQLKLERVYSSLYKQALAGHTASIKLLFQQLGELRPPPKARETQIEQTEIIVRLGK